MGGRSTHPSAVHSLQPTRRRGPVEALGIARAKRANQLSQLPDDRRAAPGFESGGWFGMNRHRGDCEERACALNRKSTARSCSRRTREAGGVRTWKCTRAAGVFHRSDPPRLPICGQAREEISDSSRDEARVFLPATVGGRGRDAGRTASADRFAFWSNRDRAEPRGRRRACRNPRRGGARNRGAAREPQRRLHTAPCAPARRGDGGLAAELAASGQLTVERITMLLAITALSAHCFRSLWSASRRPTHQFIPYQVVSGTCPA